MPWAVGDAGVLPARGEQEAGPLRKYGRREASVFDTVSTIALICLGICGTASLMASVWIVAYRVGFDEGRLTIPLRMISALAEHRVECLEEDPARTARDLSQHLGLPEDEARRLTGRSGQAGATRSTGLRSA
jgi:hypothetical protein